VLRVRPRLLDLFCGAGGCTKGYQDAGFYVVGVDISPQPNYCGDEFVLADAIKLLSGHVDDTWCFGCAAKFDAIHASPPCQAHSAVTPDKSLHENLIPETRELL
jgi:DNA (cytosine-5)-methyltransferase 1